MTLTRLGLSILIDLNRYGEPEADMESPQVKEAIDVFIRDGVAHRPDPFAILLTSKGEAWLAAILATPMPEPQWVVPGRQIAQVTKPVAQSNDGSVVALDVPAAIQQPTAPLPEGYKAAAQTVSRAPSEITLPQQAYVEVIYRDRKTDLSRAMPDRKNPVTSKVIPGAIIHRPNYGAASQFNWEQRGVDDDIVGWRYAAPPNDDQFIGTSARARAGG